MIGSTTGHINPAMQILALEDQVNQGKRIGYLMMIRTDTLLDEIRKHKPDFNLPPLEGSVEDFLFSGERVAGSNDTVGYLLKLKLDKTTVALQQSQEELTRLGIENQALRAESTRLKESLPEGVEISQELGMTKFVITDQQDGQEIIIVLHPATNLIQIFAHV